MEYAAFVEQVRRDGDRLARVADGHQADDVPSCPGWTVDQLVRHISEVYEHKIACTLLGHTPDPWPPAWPAERDALEWFADAHARLLEMFARSEPTTPSATWWPPDQTVGFWARRMAHETAVHRFDAELAAATPTPVDRALAVDGIGEILVLMLAGDWSDEPDEALTGQRVRVSADGRGWDVVLHGGEVVVEDVAGEADAVLDGEPSDVDLWLWGRVGDETVRRTGNLDAIRALRARLTLATQ